MFATRVLDSGVRASSGESELEARGFRHVDSLQSGNASYTIWFNDRTNQCLQVATAEGRYDSVTDIHEHPKCHAGGGQSGTARAQKLRDSGVCRLTNTKVQRELYKGDCKITQEATDYGAVLSIKMGEA